jgi:hypothetical protein
LRTAGSSRASTLRIFVPIVRSTIPGFSRWKNRFAPEPAQVGNGDGGVVVSGGEELAQFLVAAEDFTGEVEDVGGGQGRHFKTAELALDAADGDFAGLDVEVGTVVAEEDAEQVGEGRRVGDGQVG